MKPKQILIVVVAFVILAGLYFLQQSKRPEALQDLGYEKLGAPAADVARVKCYLAGQEDQALVLALKEGKWCVESKFGAAASETKVQEFLEKIEKLEGDLRSSSAEVLKDYGIADEQALHLELLGKDGQVLKHLLLGNQGPGYDETFVRQPGSDSVYLARTNLRGSLGVYGEDNRVPESKPWLDTTVMKIAKEDVARIETTSPYRNLVLEYRAKTPPTVGDATDVPAPEPVYVPVLVEPQVAGATKSQGIDRLAGAFASVSVADVVDRGGLEKYGLDRPQASAAVTTRSGEVRRLDFGNAVPEGNGAYYVKLEGDDLVFKMDRPKVESIFLKLSELTDLSFSPIAKEDVTELWTMRNGQKYTFVPRDGAWEFTGPGLTERFQADEVDKMLTALTQLKPQDEATQGGAEITGLDRAKAIVELTMKDGAKHTFLFGKEVPLTDGARFVKLYRSSRIYTITRADYEEAAAESGDLFNLALADWKAEDAIALRLKDATGELALMKEDAGAQWAIQGGEGGAVSADRAMALLTEVEELTPLDAVLQPKETQLDQPQWSLEVTLAGGRDYRLDIGGPQGTWGYYVQLKGEDTVFLLDVEVGNRLMALGQDLRSQEAQ